VTGDPRVARLRSLNTEATQPPWWSRDNDGDIELYSKRDKEGRFEPGEVGVVWVPGDGALVTAMRNTFPAMVTLLESVLNGHVEKNGGCDDCLYKSWPCPDMEYALAVLDTLDPP
jgi:hypothetical protein